MAEIDKRITLGSMISTAASLAGMAVIFFTGVFWIGAQDQRIADHASRIEANATNIAALSERVRAIETISARQDERLLLILDTVRKIEAKLERTAK
ncbi:hypothetical protein GL279_00465 [Paracoccus limosus]|uniref:Uncharacterized protein n=1 Tax=Paracoccus limosus TaxID=913252 RepID=A0A844H1E0_9RHOB|nr:hypothetical protein [Paracoccus limosus]MTH33071.1 hypothetical protein [Paracoccus limosus]